MVKEAITSLILQTGAMHAHSHEQISSKTEAELALELLLCVASLAESVTWYSIEA